MQAEPPVRHASAARRPHRRARGDVARHTSEVCSECIASVPVLPSAARSSLSAALVVSARAAATTTQVSSDVDHAARPRRPRRSRRSSRRSPGMVDPTRRVGEAARADGEDRQHAGRRSRSTASTRPTSSTKRSSKAGSRGSPRCSTRRRPTGSARCVRCATPTRRSSWPVGGIFAYSGGAPVSVESISDSAGEPDRRRQRRRRDVPRPRRASARTTSYGDRRPDCSRRAGNRCRRRRCSRYRAADAAAAGGTPVSVVHRRLQRRASRSTGRGTPRRSAARARMFGEPGSRPAPARRSRRRTSSCSSSTTSAARPPGGAGHEGSEARWSAAATRGCSPAASRSRARGSAPTKEQRDEVRSTPAGADDPARARPDVGRAPAERLRGDGRRACDRGRRLTATARP